ncbi:GNAT family N-acetyltransferase [Halobacillus shinanisalinarum]|uniref:GNAT family N-acetyltransferase n=1 Tax=Halobacillus shinanisalinarum TaxID=2932258 RepID=A0ABY4GUR5_9BACI|nr:GNAT family N-acetyltransferase [Halobacillus shinanisalinarum]UOQ91774.1 GNAT family N-acetyltransferase [Halobacillus shinanisalinarum]
MDGLLERFGWIDPSLNPDLDHIERLYCQNGNVFLAGFINNELVCTGALTRKNSKIGRVQRMSVKRECRRKGLGKRMLKELESFAKEMGYVGLILETNNDWISAIKLYTTNGYQIYNNDGACSHFHKTLKSERGL